MTNRLLLLRAGVLSLLAAVSPLALSTAALAQSLSMDPDDWAIDRTGTVFEQVEWQGRIGVLRLGISPPDAQLSFYNWQGYSQNVDVPAGDSFLRGDLWIPQEWDEGTSVDYVRTGLWGSAMPEEAVTAGSYVDAKATFPIISFTNVNGAGRLEVWTTTVSGGVSTGSWAAIPDSENLLDYDGWNTLDIRLLPDEDKIEYLLNGEVFYTWDQPRSEGNAPVAPEQLWAVYLKARNNGETTFDTYWSRLMAGVLVAEDEEITQAPGSLVLEDTTQTEVTISAGTIGGSLNVAGGEEGKQVTITEPVQIAESVFGTNTNFVFSQDEEESTTIGGDLELEGDSSTKGGSVLAPVIVTGNANVGGESTLGGNLVIEGTVHNAGSTSPGNSIGFQVYGGIDWTSTHTYAVEINDAGLADLVIVDIAVSPKSTNINLATMGNITVSSVTSGSFLVDHDYVIFATNAVVLNNFDPDDVTTLGDLAFLTPHLRVTDERVTADYDFNTLFTWPGDFDPDDIDSFLVLTLSADGAALEEAAATPNQRAVAETLEDLASDGNAAATAAYGQPDDAAAQLALAQLSGSAHASVASLVLESGQLVDDVLSRRLRQSGDLLTQSAPLTGYAPLSAPDFSDPSPVMWGEMLGAWGVSEDPDNGGRLERRSGGLAMGLESRFGKGALLGLSASYTATSFTLADEGAAGSVDSFRASVYGASGSEGLLVRGGASYEHNGVDMDRTVAMLGYSDTLSSAYDVGVARGFVEVAAALPLGETWFEPFLGLSGAYSTGYDYAETGGDAALSGSVDAQLTGWTNVGVRVSQDMVVGDGTLLTMGAAASWRHALGDTQPTAVHSLSGGADFSAAGVPLAADVLAAELNSTWWLNPEAALSLSYTGALAAHQQVHALQAGLAVKF